MAKAGTIRGLQVFISDIRACQNREQETRRVDKELAKIRAKFGDDKKSLTAYDRKKYVWKLLYIYMLGYDVEFGHRQACDLIPAQKYSEKQVGYMACSILMNEKDEFLRLAINAIHNDLTSRNEAFQCIALTFVGNIAGQEMADTLTPDVLKLLTSGTARPIVRKKAALCLLRLLRKTPVDQMLINADTFSPIMIGLLEDRDLGVLLGSVTLLLGICTRTGSGGYEMCQGRLLKLLERLVFVRDITPDYTYYGIASPWLQIKVLRALQYFGPPDGPQANKVLHDLLQTIFNACGDAGRGNNVNKANAQYAILFEAIALCLALDFSKDLLASSVTALGRFMSVREPNIRYLALENMTRLALVPEVLESIRGHQDMILANLKDPDVSIRRRAMDLLFTMCDATNAASIVDELVKYLTIADFSMREELVLKVAILAEKYAPNVQWYVDVALALLERAGDFCSEDIWHRVVQLVTNNDNMQAYAARSVVDVLRRGAAHESLMATAAYILGEYGKLIKSETPPLEMFNLLHQHFPTLNLATKGLLLTAYLKLLLLEPSNEKLQHVVTEVYGRYSRMMDPDLQQRAVEYLELSKAPDACTKNYVLPMPRWEGRESTLLRRLQAQEGFDTDAADSGVIDKDDTVAATTQTAAAAGGLSLALGGDASLPPPPTSPSRASPRKAPQAAAAPGSPAKAASAPAAAPAAAAKAPEIDLLGGDLLGDVSPPVTAGVLHSNGSLASGDAGGMVPKGGTPKMDLLDELFSTGPITTQSTTAPTPPHTGSADPFDLLGPVATVPAGSPYGAPAAMGGPPGAGYNPSYGVGPSPYHQGPYGGYSGTGFTPNSIFTGSTEGLASGASLATAGSAPVTHSAYFSPTSSAAAAGAAGVAGIGLNTLNSASSASPSVMHTGGSPMAQRGAGGFGGGWPGSAGGVGSGGGAPISPLAGAAAAAGEESGFGPLGGAAAGLPGTAGEWRLLGDVQQWYNALLIKDKGILYEDTFLQIGLQSSFAGSQGQLVLFLGNKSQGSLDRLSLTCSPHPALHIAVGLYPQQLAPKRQERVTLQVTSQAPFVDTPVLQLHYQTAAGFAVSQTLQLPLAPHKFMVPEPAILKHAFFDSWKTFTGPPCKLQEMVERPVPLSMDATIALMRGMQFGVEHAYLDPSPHNEAGAGYFVCGPPGAEQRTLCQCRVEANPANRQQFRVTVAAAQPQLATALHRHLVLLLRTS